MQESLAAFVGSGNPDWESHNFDENNFNDRVGWTYAFDVPKGATISGATLSVNLRPSASIGVETARFFFDGSMEFGDNGYYWWAPLAEFGYPIPEPSLLILLLTLLVPVCKTK